MIQILDSHIAHSDSHNPHSSIYAALTKDIAGRINVFILFNEEKELKCFYFLNPLDEFGVVKTDDCLAGDMSTIESVAELYILGRSGKNSLFAEEQNHMLKTEIHEQVMRREGQNGENPETLGNVIVNMDVFLKTRR